MKIDSLDWVRSHYSRELTPKLHKKQVIVMGWVRAIRGSAKLRFLQLADREGTVQILIKNPSTKLAKQVETLTRESVIAVKGIVSANKTAPNGLEIIPQELKILNIAKTPLPMEVVTKKTPAELLTRLNSRFIDLRKPEIAAIFNITDTLKISFMNYFDQQDFINIDPPIIVSAATEGGAELFPVDYFGEKAFLAQSPQLYKQMLMASGLDKISIVGPVFRAEPHSTYRHINQATQMDIEVGFVRNEEDVLKFFDDYLKYAVEQVKKRCAKELKVLNKQIKIKLPIKRVTYDQVLKDLNKMGIKLKWGEDLTPEAERKICTKYNPVLITKWPTSIRSFYCMPEPNDKKRCRAFDLLLNGIEISSGAQRIHNYEELVKSLKSRKLKPKNFKFYLDAFQFGMPSHSGWSIGLERLTMALLNLQHIKESTLFPRTKEILSP